MKPLKITCTALLLLALLVAACNRSASGTYALRTFGIWTVGESRTCMFVKKIDNAPCFATEQMRNGSDEPQHEYLVEVTFDKPIPFRGGPYGVRCRLQSPSKVWCHVE
jgi:hypothetical protein